MICSYPSHLLLDHNTCLFILQDCAAERRAFAHGGQRDVPWDETTDAQGRTDYSYAARIYRFLRHQKYKCLRLPQITRTLTCDDRARGILLSSQAHKDMEKICPSLKRGLHWTPFSYISSVFYFSARTARLVESECIFVLAIFGGCGPFLLRDCQESVMKPRGSQKCHIHREVLEMATAFKCV